MVKRNFLGFKGPKSVRLSRGQFRFCVEAFDSSARDLSFGTEPVQNQGAMPPEHPCHLFHGIKSRSENAGDPCVEELSGPRGRDILPEGLEGLFQQIGPDRFQVAPQEFRQAGFLGVGEVFPPTEEDPLRLGQDRFFPFALQGADLIGPDLVDCLSHVTHNVEPIENMYGLGGLLGNDCQVGLPHIGGDELETRAFFRSQPVEEAAESLHRPVLADPQKAFAVLVDLVHQRDVGMAFFEGDLVDPDGQDPGRAHVFPAPGDGHCHRLVDSVPCGVERLGRLLPGQPLGPPGQKPGEGFRKRALGVVGKRPGHAFHLDLTPGTVHPPGRVDEKHRDSPERDERKPSRG